MSLAESVLIRIPEPYRGLVVKHRELIKFAVVGGTTWVIDTVSFYALTSGPMAHHPVKARLVAVVIATIASYILNRQWSFRTRGGRQQHHEMLLFFIISGIAAGITAAPLYVSRYVLNLTSGFADFVSGLVIGVLLAMGFRFWAFKKFVFPHENGRSGRDDEELEEELSH